MSGLFLVSAQFDYKPMTSPDFPFHRRLFRYEKADWDTFRSYISESPLPASFKRAARKTAAIISEWIFPGMECFISQNNYSK